MIDFNFQPSLVSKTVSLRPMILIVCICAHQIKRYGRVTRLKSAIKKLSLENGLQMRFNQKSPW